MTKRYAQIENGRVLRVVVCESQQWLESRLGGTWVETKKQDETEQYAGIDMFVDPVVPQKFDSIGNSIVLSHKQFGSQWGWRAEINVRTPLFEPGVRAVAIYGDSEHTQYLYTTGAFIWDATAEKWATEWNEGRSDKADIHWAILYASLQEQTGTLAADADTHALFLTIGVPTESPEQPDVTEWAPGQSVVVGDLRTYQDTTYRCLQSHTTQAGWTPPVVPALWEAV